MARIAVLLLALFWAASARAGAPRDAAAGWAWTEVRADRIADFNRKCGKTLDPRQAAGWDDPCRQVSAQFLVDVLTEPKYRDQIPQHGLRLIGASVAGAIDLSEVDIPPEVRLESSRFDGALTLDDSRWHQLVSFRGSAIEGDFRAERLHADSSLLIDGRAGTEHASIAGNVDLAGARVGGDLDMQSSRFGGVIAWGARIDGDLLLRESAFAGGVELAGIKIGGNLSTVEAWFTDGVELASAGIGGSAFMRGATFADTLSLRYARIGGLLDLADMTAASIDLSGADATELQLSGLHWHCPATARSSGLSAARASGRWALGDDGASAAPACGGAGRVPKMILRDAHFGDLQDSVDAWPPVLDLAGFHYERLGGGGPDPLVSRTPEQWKDWLSRDKGASGQPYAQLGAVLAAAGDRDTADRVAYFGREHERQRSDGIMRQGWLAFLSLVDGYGIAGYMWRVLPWVIGFTAIGTAVLAYSANARRHGAMWMIGASLHRLLPVVSLYREFDDFFDNPQARGFDPRNLRSWQVFYFAFHAIVGWGLGLILLAAMSGITQSG